MFLERSGHSCNCSRSIYLHSCFSISLEKVKVELDDFGQLRLWRLFLEQLFGHAQVIGIVAAALLVSLVAETVTLVKLLVAQFSLVSAVDWRLGQEL